MSARLCSHRPAASTLITCCCRYGHLLLSLIPSLSHLSVLRLILGCVHIKMSDKVTTVLNAWQTQWHQFTVVFRSLKRTQGPVPPAPRVGCALLLTRLLATYVFQQADIHDALCEIMWLLSLPDVSRAAARPSLAVRLILPSHQPQLVSSLLSA